jgi:WD40 repeat protein
MKTSVHADHTTYKGTMTTAFALAVLAASSAGVLRKLDWTSRRLLREEVTDTLLSISAMSLSATGNHLATGDGQGVVRLWDTEALREVAVLGSHPRLIGAVRFQPRQPGKSRPEVMRSCWR